jgi:hypothetical protein
MQTCPDCYAPGHFHLDSISRTARVDYYRCNKCGHVWQVPKNGEPGTAGAVTEPRKSK